MKSGKKQGTKQQKREITEWKCNVNLLVETMEKKQIRELGIQVPLSFPTDPSPVRGIPELVLGTAVQ